MSEYISVKKQLPKDVQKVMIKFISNGIERFTKGFFYMNGNHPTFASYGSEIINVVAWKPM